LDGAINTTLTVQGSSITARLVSDYSVTDAGVTVSISVLGGSNSVTIINPSSNHFQTGNTITVNAVALNLQTGWGIKFVLNEGTIDEKIIIDKLEPYAVDYTNINKGIYTIDAYVIDASDIVQVGTENHDSVQNVARGDKYIALGDSITFGYGDDDSSDDTSFDGRNTGGGYEPILNDYLTLDKGYPHTIIEEGFPTETTQQGLARLPSVLASHPDASIYLILYGTNDSPTWSTLESGKGLNIGDVGYTGTYKDYMQQMINLIINAGKQLAIAKVPVVLGAQSVDGNYTLPITGNEYRNVKTREFNDVIDELIAIPSNNILIEAPDFYTYYFNNYTDEYFDNLHPNGLGYRSMADLWRDVLTQ